MSFAAWGLRVDCSGLPVGLAGIPVLPCRSGNERYCSGHRCIVASWTCSKVEMLDPEPCVSLPRSWGVAASVMGPKLFGVPAQGGQGSVSESAASLSVTATRKDDVRGCNIWRRCCSRFAMAFSVRSLLVVVATTGMLDVGTDVGSDALGKAVKMQSTKNDNFSRGSLPADSQATASDVETRKVYGRRTRRQQRNC